MTVGFATAAIGHQLALSRRSQVLCRPARAVVMPGGVARLFEQRGNLEQLVAPRKE
jgi:hypothetical protein